MPETTSMSTPELLEALRGHYLKYPEAVRQGSVFLTEVTAPNRLNRADAIHVGLWASRGYTVDVHELKTSRTDFQRELDNPAKAEAWWPHSNTFWIVAPSTAVAPPELLPPGWGLMVPSKARRFKTVVKAEHRDLRPSTALLAALLVSMETDLGRALEVQRQNLDTQRYREVNQARREAALQGAPTALRDQVKYLEQLEQLIGFKLDYYDGTHTVSVNTLAAAIREAVIERMAVHDLDYVLKNLARNAGELAKSAERARKDIADRRGRAELLPATAAVSPSEDDSDPTDLTTPIMEAASR